MLAVFARSLRTLAVLAREPEGRLELSRARLESFAFQLSAFIPLIGSRVAQTRLSISL